MQRSELLPSSKQGRVRPEFARMLGIVRFSRMVRIVEADYQELDRLLWIICETPVGDDLFSTDNRSTWEEAMAEAIRLLRELVASVSALINHCSYLYRQMYQASGRFPEYEKELTARFTENEVIQFVQRVGSCYVHHLRAAIGTRMTVVDLHNDMFEKKVTLTKTDLLNFGWSEVAMRFIDLAPQSIDLRQTLDDYQKSIQSFCDWFSQRISVLSAIDFQVVNDYLSAKRDSTPRSYE